MPLHQDIKCGHGERQTGVQIHPDPVHDFLAMADEGQHRSYYLHEYAILLLPRRHSLRLAGSPSATWKAVSRRIIMRSSHCRMSPCKVLSGTLAVAQSHATAKPY